MTVPTQESSESQASSCSVIIIASSVPSDAKRSARTAAAKLSPLPRAESFTCSSEETYFSPAEDLSAGKLIRKSANLESSTAAQSAAFEALTKSAALTFLFSEWRVPTAFFLCSAVISPENATQSKLLPSEDNSSFPNSVPS